jgi:circadian clock protein KaiB
MTRPKPASELEALEAAAQSTANEHYVFRLFVTGTTPHSANAIVCVRRFCEERLAGRFTLAISDLLAHPALAKTEQIFATPTLIRDLPLPRRYFVGNMSQMERVLLGPPLQPAGKKRGKTEPKYRNG